MICIIKEFLTNAFYLIWHHNKTTNIASVHQALEIPAIKIFHYCGGLNFASKNVFRSTLYRKVGLKSSTDSPKKFNFDNGLLKTTSKDSSSFEFSQTDYKVRIHLR